MKVVICGAGQVGYHLAKYLSADGNDVTIIDIAPEVIHEAVNSLDVQGIVGSASHPDILHRAGIEEAAMLIAVTQQDEVNMIACQIAHSLFKTPTKIARIRDQTFLDAQWASMYSTADIAVDYIISPEQEVALAIEKTLAVPGAFEVFHLANGLAYAIGVRALEGMAILRTPLKHLKTLFPELNMSVIGIIRDNELLLPSGDDQIIPGDAVYFIVAQNDVRIAMSAFNFGDQQVQRVMVLGSGGIGLRLAQNLAALDPPLDVLIVERDRKRASFVAQELENAIVLNGDALDADILKEGGVEKVDTVVTITHDDKINILSALLAKSLGARQAICLVNKISYSALIFPLGIDALISPRAITVSSILQYVRRGRVRMAYPIQDAKAEIVDLEVVPNSVVIGKELKSLELPKRSVIMAAVARGDELFPAKPSFVVEVGDRLLMLVTPDAIKKIEKIFSARI